MTDRRRSAAGPQNTAFPHSTGRYSGVAAFSGEPRGRSPLRMACSRGRGLRRNSPAGGAVVRLPVHRSPRLLPALATAGEAKHTGRNRGRVPPGSGVYQKPRVRYIHQYYKNGIIFHGACRSLLSGKGVPVSPEEGPGSARGGLAAYPGVFLRAGASPVIPGDGGSAPLLREHFGDGIYRDRSLSTGEPSLVLTRPGGRRDHERASPDAG